MRERSSLLNRIKPETAQPLDQSEMVVFPSIGFDDDEDFWERKEKLRQVK